MGARKFGLRKGAQPAKDHDKARAVTLTRKQLRKGLVAAGKSANFIADLIAALPDNKIKENAIIDWEDTVSYERDHPLILRLIPATGFSHAEIDTMWIAAAKT